MLADLLNTMRLDGQVHLTYAQKSGNSNGIANSQPSIVGQLVLNIKSLQGEVKMLLIQRASGTADHKRY